ncbi:transcription factor TFIIIB component B'' homolog [Pelodytes ibericus]
MVKVKHFTEIYYSEIAEAKTITNEETDNVDKEEDNSQLVVPRVKVAEDGSIILDEESLTVEVTRAKGVIVEGNDPIFERGSTTTYSSFRRNKHSKPWSNQETDMFFLAISMVGTDFSMIGQLFPHRERIEIKNKFKREERANGWRIDKAFREKKAFDLEFFASLLERALAAKNKKQRSPKIRKSQEKKTVKPRKKPKDKQTAEPKDNVYDRDAADLSGEETLDSRIAEKENEESPGGLETPDASDLAPVKKRRQRKKKEADAVVSEEENRVKKRTKPRKKSKAIIDDVESTDNEAADLSEREGVENEEITTEETQPPDSIQEKKRRARKKKDDLLDPEVELLSDAGATVTSLEEEETGTCEKLDHVENVEEVDGAAEEAVCTIPEGTAEFTDGSINLFSEESDGWSGDEMVCSCPLNMVQNGIAVNAEDVWFHWVVSFMLQREIIVKQKEKSSFGNCWLQLTQKDTTNIQSHEVPQASDLSFTGEEPTSVCENPMVASHKESPVETEDCMVLTDIYEDAPERPSASEELDLHAKDTDDKSSLPVRGHIVSPKPNLIRGRPALEMQDAPEEKTNPAADDLKQIHPKMEVCTLDVKSIKNNSSSIPVCNASQKDSDSELSEQARLVTRDSDSVSVDSGPEGTKLETSNKEKPSGQTVRGRLVRPKPNLTKASGRPKRSDQSHTGEHTGESAQLSGKPLLEVPGLDKGREDSAKADELSVSKNECRPSSIKPTPLIRGRFQKPKPNIVKAPARTGKPGLTEDIQEVKTEQAAGDASSIQPCHKEDISTIGNVSKHKGEKMEVSPVDESCTGEDASVPCKSPKKSISEPLESQPCPVSGNSESEEFLKASMLAEETMKLEQLKPIFPARSSLQKPKPTLEPNRADGAEKDEDKVGASASVPCKSPEKSCSELLESSLLQSAQPDPGNVDTKGGLKQSILAEEALKPESLKPTTPGRSRLQRPKPNLERAAAKRGSKAVEESTKDENAKPMELHLPSTSEILKCEVKGDTSLRKTLDEVSMEGSIFAQGDHHCEESSPSQEMVKNEVPSLSLQTVLKNNAQVPVSPEKEDQKPDNLKPAVLSRGRFQRPKPNLGRAVVRRSVPAAQENSDEEKNKATEQSLSPALSISTTSICEDGPQVKCTARDDLTQSPSVLSPGYVGDALNSTTSSVVEPVQDLSVNGAVIPTEDSASSAIKPADLRRGRLIRPKPNLARASSRKESRLEGEPEETQTKTVTDSPRSDYRAAQLSGRTGNESAVSEVSSSPVGKRKVAECGKDVSPKRRRPSGIAQTLERDLEPVSLTPGRQQDRLSAKVQQNAVNQGEQQDGSSSEVDCVSAGEEQKNPASQRSRFGRQLKRPLSTPPAPNQSENKTCPTEKEKTTRITKPSIGKGKLSNSVAKKSKGKTTLVKLRASQEEEEEEDDAELDFEEEDYDLAPHMVNQAPVFVPFSLRSPKPVAADIEETVEEFEIPVDVLEVQNIPENRPRLPTDYEESDISQCAESGDRVQHASPSQSALHNAGHIDGSTEAAMTLISMGTPVFQARADVSENKLTPKDKVKETMLVDPESNDQFQASQSSEGQADIEDTKDARLLYRLEENDNDEPNAVLGKLSDHGEAQPGGVVLECLPNQNPEPVTTNDTVKIEQMECTSVPEDGGMQDNPVQNEFPAEETTFILTLVEIPINSDYPYSFETLSPDESLPAPVLISTGSVQDLSPSESQSMEPLLPSVPESCETHFAPVVENLESPLSKTSRKRTASSLSGSHMTPPEKKAQLQESLQQEESHQARETSGNCLKEEADCWLQTTCFMTGIQQEPSSAKAKTEPSVDSPCVQNAGLVIKGERDSLYMLEPTSIPAERDALNHTGPLPCAYTALPSKATLKRPGKKPLGILGLVCKDKEKGKEKDLKSKKKNVPKPHCKMPLSVQKTQQCVLAEVNVPSNEVPSPSTSTLPTGMAPRSEIIIPKSDDSDNQIPKSQGVTTSHEDGSEEEIAAVSEYFFDDIFMPVDDD